MLPYHQWRCILLNSWSKFVPISLPRNCQIISLISVFTVVLKLVYVMCICPIFWRSCTSYWFLGMFSATWCALSNHTIGFGLSVKTDHVIESFLKESLHNKRTYLFHQVKYFSISVLLVLFRDTISTFLVLMGYGTWKNYLLQNSASIWRKSHRCWKSWILK